MTGGQGRMQKLSKLVLLFVFLFSMTVTASAQEPNPNFNEELDQETPQQQKQEAQKPDAKASAGDLAKATQNPVASLISVPLQKHSTSVRSIETATRLSRCSPSYPFHLAKTGTSSPHHRSACLSAQHHAATPRYFWPERHQPLILSVSHKSGKADLGRGTDISSADGDG